MGRLNNKADCKSFMTENDHSAVHRPAALRPTAQAAARCKKCMALRCVKAGLPAITPKQQKTLLRWDGFSLSDIFPVLTDFAVFLPLARICYGVVLTARSCVFVWPYVLYVWLLSDFKPLLGHHFIAQGFNEVFVLIHCAVCGLAGFKTRGSCAFLAVIRFFVRLFGLYGWSPSGLMVVMLYS